jgi:hypothetical protein
MPLDLRHEDRELDPGAQMRLHTPPEWKRAHAQLFRDPYDPQTTRAARDLIRKWLGWTRSRENAR